MYGLGFIAIPMFPFLLASYAASIILLVIAATSFRDLTVGAKVATILHFCTGPLMMFPVGTNYSPFLLVAIAAAYAGAEGSVRSLSKLEISFIVLSIVGNFMNGSIRLARQFVFDGILYKEWIRTYTFGSAEDSEKRFTAKWNRLVNKLVNSVAEGIVGD
jgi:hypothetical protein